MAHKIYINSDNTATFTCPECGKTKNADVSRFANREKTVKIKATCACGHSYNVFLERRRQFRKNTNLPGIFRCTPESTRVLTTPYKDQMLVVDISRTGLRLKILSMPNLHVGDQLNVEFNLDDKNQSLISRDVIIKNINAPYVGVQYAQRTHHDSIIGFYLFK